MNFETDQILIFALILLWLDCIIVVATLWNKTKINLDKDRQSEELAELAHLFERKGLWNRKKVRRLFQNYLLLKQSIDLPEKEHQKILNIAKAERIKPHLRRSIHSHSKYRRMESTLGLALVADDSSRLTLENALIRERNFTVKLFMANSLADIKDPRSIGVLADSLLGAHRWYRSKVNMLIASFGMAGADYLRGFFWRQESEIVELLIDVSGQCICEELKDYLVSTVRSGPATLDYLGKSVHGCRDKSCAYCVHGRAITEDFQRNCKYHGIVPPTYKCLRFHPLVTSRDPVGNQHQLIVAATAALETYFSKSLDDPFFLENSDKEIRAIAVRSLGNGMAEENVKVLLQYLNFEATLTPAKAGLSRILGAHPQHIPIVVAAFTSAQDDHLRQNIAEVLAGRIEYFVARLGSRDGEDAANIILELIKLGKVTEIIEFLKLNKDIELENMVLRIIGEQVHENDALRTECALYLPERLLAKLGLDRIINEPPKREEKRDWKMVRSLYYILIFSVFFFPLLYVVRHYGGILTVPFIEQFRTFVVEYNYDFAFYSVFVNLLYIILLLLSVIKVGTSKKLWNLKTMSMLFKPRMLPSVSIIAPAFNEEKTIIESANSLLNLKYPDYELVIVNDGSLDNTLTTLISYYGLKRMDYQFSARLKTMAVRGIYMNPAYPKLIVVNKENGGKADSLNAGINIASKEYFCGIDADSLLEPDSLLKIASLTLNYGIETPAMGGNVFPINGCTVDRGKLTSIALPENNLAKLQTIEYLRAFMCGRLGWVQINSLLIISGAFGLFRKERVISTGGYLTKSERYGKDTVGEDMELVVRISRFMREKRLKYRIGYAFNANCWTEVPENLKTLRRQRNRWHRGLIDILYFHRKLIFSPAYGRMGMVAMPYYLIFELIGPLFEMQGYIMIAFAAVFGLMSLKLALVLFISTIHMGILISMSSILIAEQQTCYFNYRDTLKMLGIAILENFGPRQLFSMWRVSGFFNAMKKPQGWGKMERKGFSVEGQPSQKASQQPAGSDKR
ncbi:MAG: glycosyltransferase [Spirochaetaceae bacterium]|nr:glycosyltransferase [Spirochaetaceae bacterium]